MPSPSSKIRFPEGEGARTLASLLAVLSALGVVTCAGARRAPASPGQPERQATATGGVSAGRPVTLPGMSPQEAVPPASRQRGGAGVTGEVAPNERDGPPELRRFRGAMARLVAGERKDALRILWLGDSHTAADFLPNAVRRPLAERAGSGGPGFLYLGLGLYRHSGVKVTREGKWHVRPKQPSLWIRQDDGVFGLGGIRVTPATSESVATIELSSGAIRGEARWDLAYRLRSSRDRFTVTLQGGETVEAGGAGAPVGKITHLDWRTPKDGAITLRLGGGEPEIFGVVVEDTEPGVVVDTLGINGARMGTPLAWEVGPWVEEARRRSPALVVLAYGTNEVGDQVAPFRYAADLEGLVARIRLAAPDAECLVMGPTDRAGPEWTSLPRVREIEGVQRGVAERAGCAFFSAVEAMGGDGGIKRWADQSPPLAAADRVHLTPRGYASLGASLATSLLGEVITPEAP